MKIFIQLCFIFITFSVYAQNEIRIDSIDNALKTAEAEEKHKLLVEGFNETLKSDNKKALSYVNKISENTPFKKSEVLYYKGKIHYYNKEYDKAIQTYESSIAIEVKDLKFVSKSYASISEVYRTQNNFDKSFEVIKKGIERCEKSKDSYGLYVLYKESGLCYYYLGNFPNSGRDFEKAVNFLGKDDSNSEKAGLLMNIGIIYFKTGDNLKSLENYEKASETFAKLKDSLNIASIYVNQALTYDALGQLDNAIDILKKANIIFKKLDIKSSMANTYESIGLIFLDKGKLDVSLKYQMKALKIREQEKDTSRLVNSYANLANIYSNFNDTVTQYNYLLKALKINLKTNNSYSISNDYQRIGNYWYNRKNYDSTFYYYNKSVKLKEEIGDLNGISILHNGYGNVYIEINKLDSALYYYTKALDFIKTTGDASFHAGLLSNIGVIYYDLGQYNKAIPFYKKSLKIRLESGIARGIFESYLTLANVYGKTKQFKLAYEYLSKHMEMKDSVFNENMSSQIAEMRTIYETEKKSDSLKIASQKFEVEQEKREASENKNKALTLEKQRQTFIIIGIGIGLILSLFLVFIIMKRSREKKKANAILSQKNYEITEQRDIIEEKNKEIIDSIQYAKRIQTAILPPNKLVKEWLTDSFIVYQPKDIVAGDFYWMEKKDNKILFAAADCTGHGVPGAMVSVICNGGLNRAVREFDLSDPGKILNKTREIVIQEFEKSEEDVKDGMDIALCSLDGNILEYSGANNPLWIIRKGSNEVEEIKANKQPIGKFDNMLPYDTHSVSLNKGDTIYIFSDGYADQFGGNKGKKMKTKGFKELLLSMQDKDLNKQKSTLESQFTEWKGKMEQIDDVCIIGVRI